ncbi:MAG TPA: EAL domain-containing protein [Novosphingobium sp.]|nr:EAL domain-containing protein [Chiayiivirga sp.]HQQ08695.1 EAL domain-containing protein [Novosphingobium sp.]
MILVGAYLALAWTSLLASGPTEVTLIWPPTGIAFGALLYFGPRWWPLPAVAVLLVHLLVAPVPALFIPWSIGANVIGGVCGVWLVRRLLPDVARRFDLPAGGAAITGGLFAACISSAIAAAGLWASGMTPGSKLLADAVRWAMGDLFGIVTMTPMTLSVLYLAFDRKDHSPSGNRLNYATNTELNLWAALVILIVAGEILIVRTLQAHALAMIGLPLAALIWAAVRLPPWVTTISNAIVTVLLATAVTLGLAGPAPATPIEATILAAFLCVIATIPITLAMGIHQSRVASARLLLRASTDPLTGALSRSAFEYHTRRALQLTPLPPLALAYIDLDRFRLINDAFNHEIGDNLICAVAGVLRANLSPGDELARIGGDEFAVLMHDAKPNAAAERARRLCEAVAAFRFQVGEHVAAPTISIGIVSASKGRTDFGKLLALADTACFAAKEQGGNRVQRVESGPRDIVQKSSETMRSALYLGQAIEQDHFRLHCQSIVPLQTPFAGALHFEVLTRLQAPGQELILPGQFIAAAERYGLAARLDRHVLDKTLHWFGRHPEHARRVELCAINLSASSLQDESFLDHLTARLASSTLRPEQLCFELTETAALVDLGRAQSFIAAVRAIGCRFSLDDFGTGFCSFGYLRSLDVDFFKIDGSFVREVEASALAHAIVRSITEIARVMRKQTIAECTENEAIRHRLVDLGVSFAQGYAIDRPIDMERYFSEAAQTSELA